MREDCLNRGGRQGLLQGAPAGKGPKESSSEEEDEQEEGEEGGDTMAAPTSAEEEELSASEAQRAG